MGVNYTRGEEMTFTEHKEITFADLTVAELQKQPFTEMKVDNFTTKVALVIYAHNLDEKPIWFTKLVDIFKDRVKVARAIDWLSDWMIIQGGYGETEKDHAGYCYHITEYAKTMLKDLLPKKRSRKTREPIVIHTPFFREKPKGKWKIKGVR